MPEGQILPCTRSPFGRRFDAKQHQQAHRARAVTVHAYPCSAVARAGSRIVPQRELPQGTTAAAGPHICYSISRCLHCKPRYMQRCRVRRPTPGLRSSVGNGRPVTGNCCDDRRAGDGQRALRAHHLLRLRARRPAASPPKTRGRRTCVGKCRSLAAARPHLQLTPVAGAPAPAHFQPHCRFRAAPCNAACHGHLPHVLPAVLSAAMLRLPGSTGCAAEQLGRGSVSQAAVAVRVQELQEGRPCRPPLRRRRWQARASRRLKCASSSSQTTRCKHYGLHCPVHAAPNQLPERRPPLSAACDPAVRSQVALATRLSHRSLPPRHNSSGSAHLDRSTSSRTTRSDGAQSPPPPPPLRCRLPALRIWRASLPSPLLL